MDNKEYSDKFFQNYINSPCHSMIMEKMQEKAKALEDNPSFEDKGPGGTCTHCLKSFDNLQTFLRHVTHSKACLDAHSPGCIEKLKRESRLRSRKSWYQRYKGTCKEYRENVKKVSGKPKNYYIPVAEKRTPAGKAFSENFQGIFQSSWKKVEKMIETISSQRNLEDELRDKITNEALDFVFSHDFLRGMFDKDFESFEPVFDAMEKEFELFYKRGDEKASKRWADDLSYDMGDGLYHYSLDRAFRNFFREEKFKTAFAKAEEQEKSSQLPINDGLGQICKENGLQLELQSFLNKILQNQFTKFNLSFKEKALYDKDEQ